MRIASKFFFIIFYLYIFFNTNTLLAKKAAIIIDFDTQEVLFEVNADTLNYPASLAKVMTIYILFDYLDKKKIFWDTKMNVSNVAASRSPSKLYLEEGSFIKVEDVVMALIIKSANDAATVAAEHISGNERDFAKLMTRYGKDLGMKDTTFKNASGLPNRAQLTTARDIAILSHALINNFPEKYKLFKKEKFVLTGKTYKTHNKLMKSYEGADGIKTGYIKASGFQLAFSAIKKNKRLIGVYFGGDTGKQRDQSLTFLMNKEFGELKLNTNKVDIEKEKQSSSNYKIVVGTFKYKKNAEKHLKLIKKKYPKTTFNKEATVSLIKTKGKQLYESRFQYFSKQKAKMACSRLKKYKRDCFIRG